MRIFAGLLIALGLLLAGSLGWWLLGDKDGWKPAIEAQATAHGARIKIGGDVIPGLSPYGPVLMLHDVTFDDGNGNIWLTVPLLRLVIAPMSVVHGAAAPLGITMDGATLADPSRPLTLAGALGQLRHLSAHELGVVTSAQTLVLNDVELDLQGKPQLTLAGAFDDGAPLAATLQADSLAALHDGTAAKVAGTLQVGAWQIAFSTTLSRRPVDGQVWQLLDSLQLNLNGQVLTGRAALSLAGAVPQVGAVLHAPRWVLSAATPNADPAAPVIATDPLPWAKLTAADGSLRVMIDHLVRAQADGKEIDNGPLYVQVQDQAGLLAATVIAMPPYSGAPAQLSVTADAQTQQATLALAAPRLEMASALHPWLPGAPLQGPMRINAQLQGQGGSLHALAATATGSFALQAGQAQMDPANLNPTGGLYAAGLPDGVRRPLELLFGPEKLAKAGTLGCLVVSGSMAQGVASASTMGLESDLMNMAGTGVASLGDETLRLDLVAALQTPGLGAINVPLDLSGPWRHPVVGAATAQAAGQIGTQVASHAVDSLVGGLIGTHLGKSLGDKIGAKAAALANNLGGNMAGLPPVAMPYNPCDAPVVPAAAAPQAIVPDAVTGSTDLTNLLPQQMVTEINAARDHLMGPLQNLLDGAQP